MPIGVLTAKPWPRSSGTSSPTAAATCSTLGTPRGAAVGDTGMGAVGSRGHGEGEAGTMGTWGRGDVAWRLGGRG